MSENRENKSEAAKNRNVEAMNSFIDAEELMAMEETDLVDGDGDSSETFKNKRIEDQLKKKNPEQNTLKFTNAARESIRFNTSLRGTAAIVSGTLIDIGFVTASNATNLLDKNKIHRTIKANGGKYFFFFAIFFFINHDFRILEKLDLVH